MSIELDSRAVLMAQSPPQFQTIQLINLGTPFTFSPLDTHRIKAIFNEIP